MDTQIVQRLDSVLEDIFIFAYLIMAYGGDLHIFPTILNSRSTDIFENKNIIKYHNESKGIICKGRALRTKHTRQDRTGP